MATTLMTRFIMKVIGKIMGLCIKITWCKKHDWMPYVPVGIKETKKKKKKHENILFGQCENASTKNFLYGGHPNSTPLGYENTQKSSRGYT